MTDTTTPVHPSILQVRRHGDLAALQRMALAQGRVALGLFDMEVDDAVGFNGLRPYYQDGDRMLVTHVRAAKDDEVKALWEVKQRVFPELTGVQPHLSLDPHDPASLTSFYAATAEFLDNHSQHIPEDKVIHVFVCCNDREALEKLCDEVLGPRQLHALVWVYGGQHNIKPTLDPATKRVEYESIVNSLKGVPEIVAVLDVSRFAFYHESPNPDHKRAESGSNSFSKVLNLGDIFNLRTRLRFPWMKLCRSMNIVLIAPDKLIKNFGVLADVDKNTLQRLYTQACADDKHLPAYCLAALMAARRHYTPELQADATRLTTGIESANLADPLTTEPWYRQVEKVLKPLGQPYIKSFKGNLIRPGQMDYDAPTADVYVALTTEMFNTPSITPEITTGTWILEDGHTSLGTLEREELQESKGEVRAFRVFAPQSHSADYLRQWVKQHLRDWILGGLLPTHHDYTQQLPDSKRQRPATETGENIRITPAAVSSS